MTYQEKLEEARALLTKHYEVVKQTQPEAQADHKIKSFFNNLQSAGGTDDEALKQCTFEELESFGAPKLLAKRIAGIFRKGTEEKKEESTKVFKPSRVAAMSINELISFYDPRDPTSTIAGRIQQIAGNKRCIVFKTDGSVNVDASVTLLNEIRDGFGERETYSVNGIPTEIFKIGERPGQFAEENPLYPNRALRPNGDCDQTNRSWNGVDHTIRTIIYLALTKTNEIHIDSLMDAHAVIDLTVSNDEAKIRSRFGKASLLFDRLKGQGNLPSLKISLKSANNVEKNDPFGNNKHRTY
jgi:hypothetical protein